MEEKHTSWTLQWHSHMNTPPYTHTVDHSRQHCIWEEGGLSHIYIHTHHIRTYTLITYIHTHSSHTYIHTHHLSLKHCGVRVLHQPPSPFPEAICHAYLMPHRVCHVHPGFPIFFGEDWISFPPITTGISGGSLFISCRAGTQSTTVLWQQLLVYNSNTNLL